MDPATRPHAPFPLVAYADGLVARLRGLVPRALGDWDEESIHQSRVATRRLKSAVDLFRPVTSDERRKPFARAGRRLRRRLGPLRDLDVMIGHLDVFGRNQTHAEAVAWLAERLRGARNEARIASIEKGPPEKVLTKLNTWVPLREEIVEAAEAVDSLLVESVSAQLEVFVEHAVRLTDQSRASLDVHELRIAGKALRYTLEMGREQGRPLPPVVMRTFKRMQDSLGLWHDYVVLSEWAMRASLDELLAHHDTRLQSKVLALARLTLGRSQRHLNAFALLWKREGRNLVEVIRTSFPPTRSVTESEMDPDPRATAESPAPAAPPQDAAPAA